VAPELPSGDAAREQSGADGGPEQSTTDECLEQSQDNETLESSITAVLFVVPSDVTADVDVANVVYLVPDGNGYYSALSTLQLAENTGIENSATMENSQQAVALNTAEQEAQPLLATTGNSGRQKRGRKQKYPETGEKKMAENGNSRVLNGHQ